MNKKVFFAVSALAATFSFGFAQNPVQEVKLETAPDACLKYFNAQISKDAKVAWAQVEDDKDVYVLGAYELNGDKKQIVFRNNSFYCNKTQIPEAYFPVKIKHIIDTLAPGYKLVEMYYENCNREKGYRAVVQKGKGKKAVYRDLMFSVKNDFLKETPVDKTVRGF